MAFCRLVTRQSTPGADPTFDLERGGGDFSLNNVFSTMFPLDTNSRTGEGRAISELSLLRASVLSIDLALYYKIWKDDDSNSSLLFHRLGGVIGHLPCPPPPLRATPPPLPCARDRSELMNCRSRFDVTGSTLLEHDHVQFSLIRRLSAPELKNKPVDSYFHRSLESLHVTVTSILRRVKACIL